MVKASGFFLACPLLPEEVKSQPHPEKGTLVRSRRLLSLPISCAPRALNFFPLNLLRFYGREG
jgi:hypothetical protein